MKEPIDYPDLNEVRVLKYILVSAIKYLFPINDRICFNQFLLAPALLGY